MALDLITPPALEPLTAEDAKRQCRITHTREDAHFQTFLIPAARSRAELATQRQMMTATYDLGLDAWPCEGWIDVPRAPLQSVTSITYVDAAGVLQTLDPSHYRVDAPRGAFAARGRIAPAPGHAWPAVRTQLNAVVVRFVAGYGAKPKDVPALLRHAMLRDIASMYEHREDMVVGTITAEMPRSSTTVYHTFKSRARQRAA